MNFPTKLILIYTMFLIGCNQFSEQSYDIVIVPVDTNRLFDYWEHSFVAYATDGEPQPDEIWGYNYEKERGRQWRFKGDSVYITEYPIFLSGSQYFEVKEDSLILPFIHFFPRRNRVIFRGDTLILRSTHENGTMATNYFLKTKHDTSDLDFLISEKVNWSLFTGDILDNANQPSEKDSLYPYIPYLDLRESNNINYFTSKDTLFYKDSIGNHAFKFRYDMMNYLGLYYLTDTTTERVMFFKFNPK